MPDFDLDAALLEPVIPHPVFRTHHDAVGREWDYAKEALCLDDTNALNFLICDATDYVIGQAPDGSYFTMHGDWDFHGGTFDEAVQFLRDAHDRDADPEGAVYRAHDDEVLWRI